MTALVESINSRIKSRLITFLLIAFAFFNGLFFFGIFYRLATQLTFYEVILPPYTSEFLLFSTFLLGATSLLVMFFFYREPRLGSWYHVATHEFSALIDEHLALRSSFWIAISSGAVLFLELSVIRWMSALFPELSQFRNFSLLACFLGISLGYLTGAKKVSFVPFVLPLLGLQFLQISMVSMFYPAMIQVENPLWAMAKSPLWQFIFIVAVGIGPGQLVGRLMHGRQALQAYGANLLGSILGVVVFNFMAIFWLPRWVWLLGIAFVYIMMFHRLKTFIHAFILFCAFLGIAYLIRQPSVLEIYSPYQRITVRTSGIGHHLGDGRNAIYSNDLYYQSFSAIDTNKIIPENDVEHAIPNADLGPVFNELKGKKVLALGAGAGANIPSLLKAGVASVVAVDIDPAIVYLGQMLNANYPYWDPRVTVIVNDGRAFLRQTHESFDYIFFLWIDSHPYVTSSSGFRIDSFIYTRECFIQAMSRLNPNGKILIYSWMNEISSRRILLTLKAATSTPVYTFKVLPHKYQGLYIVSKQPIDKTGSKYVVPWQIDIPETLHLRVLTDDWPFLYLVGDSRGILRFLPFLSMVLIISLFSVFLATGGPGEISREGSKDLKVFFLFGVAFMLLETTSIMRVSLLMGNTWQVTGYVIIAILAMAYLGNYLILTKLFNLNLFFAGSCLVGSLLISWRLDIGWLASFLGPGNLTTIAYLMLLSLPIIFSSMLFSFLIRDHSNLDVALGSNLLGSMFGGCLEYAAMIYGYKNLILLLPIIYLIALAIYIHSSRRIPAESMSGALQS